MRYTLQNTNDTPFTGTFDGQEITVPAGETVVVSEGWLRHCLGAWESDARALQRLARQGVIATSDDFAKAAEWLGNMIIKPFAGDTPAGTPPGTPAAPAAPAPTLPQQPSAPAAPAAPTAPPAPAAPAAPAAPSAPADPASGGSASVTGGQAPQTGGQAPLTGDAPSTPTGNASPDVGGGSQPPPPGGGTGGAQ